MAGQALISSALRWEERARRAKREGGVSREHPANFKTSIRRETIASKDM
jgi:hypothetical protein